MPGCLEIPGAQKFPQGGQQEQARRMARKMVVKKFAMINQLYLPEACALAVAMAWLTCSTSCLAGAACACSTQMKRSRRRK